MTAKNIPVKCSERNAWTALMRNSLFDAFNLWNITVNSRLQFLIKCRADPHTSLARNTTNHLSRRYLMNAIHPTNYLAGKLSFALIPYFSIAKTTSVLKLIHGFIRKSKEGCWWAKTMHTLTTSAIFPRLNKISQQCIELPLSCNGFCSWAQQRLRKGRGTCIERRANA